MWFVIAVGGLVVAAVVLAIACAIAETRSRRRPDPTRQFSIYAPTCKEIELAAKLRRICRIGIADLTTAEACRRLNCTELALKRLVNEPRWTLAVAIRVADGLQLPVMAEIMDLVRQNA